MKPLRALAALPLLATACCAPVPQSGPAADPVPTRSAAPSPLPAPVATPMPVIQETVYENWLDAPQSPGDWAYGKDPDETLAVFTRQGTENAAPFIIRCDVSQRVVALARRGTNAPNTPMRIRTETTQRLLTAQPVAKQRLLVAATLRADDPLLDAIALSRGRFVVETGGLETLYLPAWSEISRVIEDCR